MYPWCQFYLLLLVFISLQAPGLVDYINYKRWPVSSFFLCFWGHSFGANVHVIFLYNVYLRLTRADPAESDPKLRMAKMKKETLFLPSLFQNKWHNLRFIKLDLTKSMVALSKAKLVAVLSTIRCTSHPTVLRLGIEEKTPQRKQRIPIFSCSFLCGLWLTFFLFFLLYFVQTRYESCCDYPQMGFYLFLTNSNWLSVENRANGIHRAMEWWW